MSRGPWLTLQDIERIEAAKKRGASVAQAAQRLGLSYHVVRKVYRGEHNGPRERKHAQSNMRLSKLRLSNRITPPQHEEAATMTPEIIRQHFIDELTPAHYSRPRAAPDKFFADLTLHLCKSGYGADVLQRAAEILQADASGPFPKIPRCLWACREAVQVLEEEADLRRCCVDAASAVNSESGTGSREQLPESRPRPPCGEDESSGVPVKAAEAA